MVDEDEGEGAINLRARRQVDESGTLTPRGVTVMPDTPTEAVNAWYRETLVTLMVITKAEICGARVGDGEVDFLACAKVVDRVRGLSCGMTTHQTGGKDSKKRNVLKMTLPQQGGVFVILVGATNSSIKRPKVFFKSYPPSSKSPLQCVQQGVGRDAYNASSLGQGVEIPSRSLPRRVVDSQRLP